MDFKDIKWPETIFITGIGTDVGKSYATGWLAREISAAGHNVITQKAVQTGDTETSEDIHIHRRIMNCGLTTFDMTKITSPYLFSYPASPHLAARIDNSEIKTDTITEATRILHKHYPHVLIEGAGGLMVPLKGNYLISDYIRENKLPAILVTNGKLGSISDTLLNLYAMAHNGINIFGVIYNPYFDKDKKIAAETRHYLKEWVLNHFPHTLWFEMPEHL